MTLNPPPDVAIIRYPDPIAQLLPFVKAAPIPINSGGYWFPVENCPALRATQLYQKLRPRAIQPSQLGVSGVVDLRLTGETAKLLQEKVLQQLASQPAQKPVTWGKFIPGAGKRAAVHELVNANVHFSRRGDEVIIPLDTDTKEAWATKLVAEIGRQARIEEPDEHAALADVPRTLVLTKGAARQFLLEERIRAGFAGQNFVC